MIGRTVAQYRIEQKLGQGGMGVVYRAFDTRLHRSVALKFLPEGATAEGDALERLRREARAASALNHPNICTVYDLGEDHERCFIAMELLEGATLHERLAAGPLPIADIVDYALQLTDALDVAHSRRIVHRDLKPSNVFVTTRGLIKILDFGLATKAARAHRVLTSATVSMDPDPLTSPGTAVGTVAYMSPEQARGEPVDGRTDLFSLGAVLYEMITGRRAFPGDAAALVFDAILHQDSVPASAVNRACPALLEHVVVKALEKERAIRYQSGAEMAVDLKRLKRDLDTGRHVLAAPPPKRSWRRSVLFALVAALLAAAVAVALLWPRTAGPVSQAEWTELTHFSDSVVQPTITRDGRLLAFIRGADTFMGTGDIYLKVLPDGEPVRLTHDASIKLAPAFSPDGSLITYGTCCPSWDTWSVPVFGGTPRQWLANASALSWIDNDHLLFSEIKQGIHMGLVTADKSRTQERQVYLPPHARAMIHFSALSPDRQWVLVVEMGSDGSWLPCQLLPFDGRSPPRPVGPNAPCTAVAWSPNGRWMYFTADNGDRSHIWRQRFPDGPPEQVTAGPTAENGIAFSPDGKFFITAVGTMNSTVWLHDASGDRQLSSEAGAFDPQFAPDGSRVYYLVQRSDAQGASLNELWASDLQGHAQAVLPGISIHPGFALKAFTVSPDGKRIVYVQSTRVNGAPKDRLWTARTDNREPPRQISGDVDESEPIFTADGTVYFRVNQGGKNYLYRMRGDGSGREQAIPDPILEFAAVSRDGAWAAVFIEGERGDAPPRSVLYSLRRPQPPLTVCSMCMMTFSWDGSQMYVFAATAPGPVVGYAVPTASVLAEARKSPHGIDFAHLRGSVPLRDMATGELAPSPQPSAYAFARTTVQRNLYRIPVR